MLDKIQLEALDVESKPLGTGGPNDTIIVRDAITGGFKQTKVGDLQAAGGSVTSVNGEKGDVVLDAAKVGALPTSGGTITGIINRDIAHGTFLSGGAGFADLLGINDTGSAGGAYFGKDGYWLRTGNAANQPKVIRNNTEYEIYHKGNKPTADELGVLKANYTRGTPAAAYYGTKGQGTEGTKIRLPWTTTQGQMVSFTVRVYQSYESYDVQFSGYLYETPNNWYSPRAILTASSSTGITARMGRDDDGRAYVWLAGGQYRGVGVFNVTIGYFEGDATRGWEISESNHTPNLVYDQVVYPPFSKHNLPSAVEVGALPINGGVMTGPLVMASDSTLDGHNKVARHGGSHQSYTHYYDTISGPVTGHDFRFANGSGSYVAYQMNGYGSFSSNEGRFYSTGFRPTAGDIGAMAAGSARLPGNDAQVSYGSQGLQVCNLSGAGGAGTNGSLIENPTDDWYYHLIQNHGNNGGYYFDIASSFHDNKIYFQRVANGSKSGFSRFYTTADKPTPADIGALPSSGGSISGDLNASGTISSSHYTGNTMSLAGSIQTNNNVNASTMYSSNWFRSTGDTGWFNETYGGGIHMTDSTWVRVYNNKKFHIPNTESNALDVTGGASLGGPISCASTITGTTVTGTSDKRKKKNIKTLDNSLEKVCQLRGVSYNWKDSGIADIGVIAQEVEKVIPEVVHKAVDGTLSVDHGHLIGHLIEAIKTLEKRVKELEGR